ncbi:hypothetical protein [Cytobacillus kochii]|uniref:hypothetical protein n=1 Tax=Cytobacillus kochii TaxID=859143 RepID=UPI001CD54177|nr:hypothetical protein [Cytobacillus kochii]MCA1028854.1 hypothetical protein [Cytobacillus kochii]
MSDLSMVRDFFIIKEAFENGDFSLQTVSELIITIRRYRDELTSEQAVLLLEIPLNVLENDVELKEDGLWQKSNRDYFSGNMNVHDSDYIKELKERITLASFGLEDISDLTKYIQGNFKELSMSVEFLLRNVEVTIRDDVKLNAHSTFNKSGKAFAHYIERSFL